MRQRHAIYGSVLLCLCLACALGGCAAQERAPLSFDDQQALAADRQCRSDATQMNNEWRGNTSYFPWRAYYDMCMRRFEISDEQMRRLHLP
ncbi:MAG: hypothetical protein F8N36_03955 [Desulfovibrio sp.]|uniref:hypothetical protein n=1 Tax=Desulfovibrio sp. TaxID=885 RepID=UPI00135F0B5E|nr:hypothetical protein [Desulfovibrio sp.]MTJ92006.1 hypothetical protein [Desulfovibrio sp.]